ncbi:tetratricopeptide repeat protein [Blastopirellula marina]|uniref:Uncharacterized protein n=1 Tax=Blastopirellula marina DSM 3645 TaxID=314230 RepID=A3ZM83_9BACT|nr:tetratricopeptide repeat protein [Blastopirellula marina]EAQ82052.1 hypothetical protein DSM3645_00020 [Blastopirellula marina DSM 3645]
MIEAQIEHARLLMRQERFDKAAESLESALAHQPNNPLAHALLAACLGQDEKFDQATAHINQALQLAPDSAFIHYIHANLLYERNRPEEGLAAAQRAIEIEPGAPTYYASLARGFVMLQRWSDVQEMAEIGLMLDAEDVECLNLRALAQRQQGQTSDANASLRAAMQRDPDNAYSHANLGWSLLQEGKREEAIQHFGEALRLEPELEMARIGLIEGLKSRNTLYAWLLKYFLWMNRLSGRTQWMIMIGGYVGYRVIWNLSENNPAWARYANPLLALYVAFAIMTWIASPLLDLMLRLNRFGRLALSKEQIRTSNMIGVCLLGVLTGLALYPIGAMKLEASVAWLPSLLIAGSCGILLPTLSRIYSCSEGWPRNATIAMASVLGIGSFICITATIIALNLPYDAMVVTFNAITRPFYLLCVGGLLSQFAVNYLGTVRVRR